MTKQIDVYDKHRKDAIVAKILVDDTDYDKLKSYIWYVDQIGYITGLDKSKTEKHVVLLKDLLFKIKSNETIKYKNNSELDFTRDNIIISKKPTSKKNSVFNKLKKKM